MADAKSNLLWPSGQPETMLNDMSHVVARPALSISPALAPARSSIREHRQYKHLQQQFAVTTKASKKMLKLANEPFMPTKQNLKRKAAIYTKKHVRKLNLVGLTSRSSSLDKQNRTTADADRTWTTLPAKFSHDATLDPS